MNQSFKAYNGNSVIVCLALPENQARLLHAVTKILNPTVELEDVEDLHITLTFLGKAEDLNERKNEILQTVLDFSREQQTVSGEINGGGMFADKRDGKPVWAYFESQALYLMRLGLSAQLIRTGIPNDRPYGFIPHITMAYLADRTNFVLQFPSLPITFENISVWWAGERYNFPLISPEPTEEKEVSSTPITSYGHGPGGLFSFPGLEEEADKKAREKLPKGTSEKIVSARKAAYIKKALTPKAALYVFKDAKGNHRWLSISSTAFKDKDGEIVSTEALEKATYKMQARQNYGPLRFWHTKGLDIGECDYSNVLSRSLIESGTFINESVGRTIANKASAYKISIGFNYPSGQPDYEGVYKDIDIFERSIVPADLASNVFTGLFVSKSEVNTMNDAKQAAIVSAFKQLGLPEEDANRLLSQVNFYERSAANMDVAYKEQDLTKLSPPELLAYAQKAVTEYEQEQEAHKEITEAVTKAVAAPMQEMKAMMAKMNAMMNRMNGGKDDDDKDKEEKTKSVVNDGAVGGGRVGDGVVGGNPLQDKLNEAEKEIRAMRTQLQSITKSVQDMANASPRRATTADDNVISTVKNAALNGESVSQLNGGGQTLKDSHDAFLQFLAGGMG